jgi:glycosyltransferase involved in cell wall biosynthesis
MCHKGKQMRILLLEPYFKGSHKSWAKDLQRFFPWEVICLTMPGRYWKWRMYGGAIFLAEKFHELPDKSFDLILASDFLDLNTFLSLTRKFTSQTKVAMYFHENQFTYPIPENHPKVNLKSNLPFAHINFISALSADKLFFNSDYHQKSFILACEKYLKKMPDHQMTHLLGDLKRKTEILYLGLDLAKFDAYLADKPIRICDEPIILWNHRLEFDKNPQLFFEILQRCQESGIKFKLVILGERNYDDDTLYAKEKVIFQNELLHWGEVQTFEEYAGWLVRADIQLVTSQHDFFGVSVVEALYCGLYPLLPNDLVYPEHLDPDQFPELFYQTKEEAIDKLTNIITDKKYLEVDFHRDVKKYDWSEIKDQYLSQLKL